MVLLRELGSHGFPAQCLQFPVPSFGFQKFQAVQQKCPESEILKSKAKQDLLIL